MPGETLPAAPSSVDDVKTKRLAARKAGYSNLSPGNTTGDIQKILTLDDQARIKAVFTIVLSSF